MNRRWLISAQARTCSNDRCIRYGKKGKSTITATGLISTICSKCTHVSKTQSHQFKQPAPCEACGHVRSVTVHIRHNGELSHRPLCDACEIVRAAAVHDRTAVELRAKARRIYERRKARAATVTQ